MDKMMVFQNNVVTTGIYYFVVTCFVICILRFIQFYLSQIRTFRALAKMNTTVPRLPIIGHLFHFLFVNAESFVSTIMMFCNASESPFIIWLCYKPVVCISKPEHINIILNSSKALNKSSFYEFIKPVLGNGLFTSPVNIWKTHRRVIQRTFNQQVLDKFMVVFNDRSRKLIEKLQSEIGDEQFDVFHYMNACTLEIVYGTLLGVDTNVEENSTKYAEYTARAMDILQKRIFTVLLHFDFIFYLSNFGRQFNACNEYINKLISETIMKKKEQIENTKKILQTKSEPCKDTDFISTRKNTVPFLDLFMEFSDERDKFTDKEVRDEVATLGITGNDTSARINSFVLLALGIYPEIQERVYMELVSVFNNVQREISKEDLSKMCYLEMVIKETLRIFPLAVQIGRHISEDIELGDYTLPAGVDCYIMLLHLHRNPKYWSNPLVFDPERFSPQNINKHQPYAYIPFSAGPRNCIGLKYAMMSMKVLLAHFIVTYEVRTSYKSIEDIKLASELLLRPVDGYKINIVRRSS